MLAKDGGEVVVRVTLVQEHWFAGPRGDLELAREGPALHVARREIAVVVEPALADCDDRGMRGELLQLRREDIVELRSMVRMDTGGREQPARMRIGELDGPSGALAAGASHDHLHDTGSPRSRDDLGPVAIEAVVREIDADVDESHVHILSRAPRGYAAEMLGMRSKRALLAVGAAATASLILSTGARAADAAGADRWLDIESRIEYAYYTEDRRTLAEIAASLAADTSGGGERPYYLALASYRLADLADPHRPEEAKAPAERCASSLDKSAGDLPSAAERLALESTCLRVLAALEPLRGPYLSRKSGSALRRALELAPRNPRVLLLRALADRDEGSNPAQVARELSRATAAFELEREGVEHVPEWGAAEAYAFLGRALLEQGQALAARGALEHALLLVPDFALAHRLMARITAG